MERNVVAKDYECLHGPWQLQRVPLTTDQGVAQERAVMPGDNGVLVQSYQLGH